MHQDIKTAIFLLATGVSLIAYAHANFSTKREQDNIMNRLERIEAKQDRIIFHLKARR